MSEKTLSILEQTLVDTINASKAGIEKGIDFAQAQIPDVVQQLLVWKLTAALVMTAVCILVIIGCLLAIKKWFEQSEGAIIVPTCIIIPFAFLIGLYSALDAIKIYLAPKLYLLEYVADILR
jgi:hypothetical protein